MNIVKQLTMNIWSTASFLHFAKMMMMVTMMMMSTGEVYENDLYFVLCDTSKV